MQTDNIMPNKIVVINIQNYMAGNYKEIIYYAIKCYRTK